MVVFLAAGFVFVIPPLRERVINRLGIWYEQIQAAFFPPEEVVFIPQGTVLPTITPSNATATPTLQPTPVVIIATPSPTVEPTPLPAVVKLSGVKYEDQHGLWNYCGPTNLAMALSFWGWDGTRIDTGDWLMPINSDVTRDVYDKNVMPYEMQDYVKSQTALNATVRQGGSISLLKAFLAAGYPVLIEKGTFITETNTGLLSWMGHYQVLTGYDDNKQQFIAQDSYFTPDYPVAYDTFIGEWRAFNFIFVIIHPYDKEEEVMRLLGPLANENQADQLAAQKALDETQSLTGIDQFFAWFNRGTSLVRLTDYTGAAAAYDQAYLVYPTIPEAKRPWRMTWYQTGPYFAYYYAGRYNDVIGLVNTTFQDMQTHRSKPYLEESFVWRARAYIALGQTDAAITDLRDALYVHPNFTPALDELTRLGVTP